MQFSLCQSLPGKDVFFSSGILMSVGSTHTKTLVNSVVFTEDFEEQGEKKLIVCTHTPPH